MINPNKKTASMRLFFLVFINTIASVIFAQPINRKALVERHSVINTKADSLSSLTVGNGRFAFTVDVTGLQTFPKAYEKGVPLGTQSEWGWHSFIDTAGYKREEALRTYHLNNRDVTYSVQWNAPERNKMASNWFRQNPHRLQLGNLGFEITKKDGNVADLDDVKDIHQELNPWTGEIKSHFSVENIPVDVSTVCAANTDAIAVKVWSPMIREGRLKIKLHFPYPTGAWTDEGTNWGNSEKHKSTNITGAEHGALIQHKLDTTTYYVGLWWKSSAEIQEKKQHYFLITPENTLDSFQLSATFTPIVNKNKAWTDYDGAKRDSKNSWKNFWNTGGAIDFSGSSDKRAFELERRIILSQYLMKTQEAGNYPSQETGLTYNSWFGKPHLEMTWWHSAHWALWGRAGYLQKLMSWYVSVAMKAKGIADRQGFDGIRWQKMTDNNGDETPSSVGAFLIWQQPHFIYFAELLYRDHKGKQILNQYKDLVFSTADFMASFAYFDSIKGKYILGKGVIAAQERFKAEETYNPTYELVYWSWALKIAQEWKVRLGLPRNKKWDEVLQNWSWKETWGWDFPMTAMAATRLGMPDKAIDALLKAVQTNTYLKNGHNYQDDRLRIYLPGNGGLLSAVALMCAGYDNCKTTNPGIPKNGQWKVR